MENKIKEIREGLAAVKNDLRDMLSEIANFEESQKMLKIFCEVTGADPADCVYDCDDNTITVDGELYKIYGDFCDLIDDRWKEVDVWIDDYISELPSCIADVIDTNRVQENLMDTGNYGFEDLLEASRLESIERYRSEENGEFVIAKM